MSVEEFNPALWLDELPNAPTGAEPVNNEECGPVAALWFVVTVQNVDATQGNERLRAAAMASLYAALSALFPVPAQGFRVCDLEAYTSGKHGEDYIKGRLLLPVPLVPQQ